MLILWRLHQAFRTDEAVDISEISNGRYNIGWARDGEYLRYTVDVSEQGTASKRSFLLVRCIFKNMAMWRAFSSSTTVTQ